MVVTWCESVGMVQMTERTIYKRGSSRSLRRLLSDLLVGMILDADSACADHDPLWIISPWITDFELIDNRLQRFGALRPGEDLPAWIRFGSALRMVSEHRDVRIITSRSPDSQRFLNRLLAENASRIVCRYADDVEHRKCVVCSSFPIDGSMNITFSGVEVRGEQVRLILPDDANSIESVATARYVAEGLWERCVAV
jgi:hypothetical protein